MKLSWLNRVVSPNTRNVRLTIYYKWGGMNLKGYSFQFTLSSM